MNGPHALRSVTTNLHMVGFVTSDGKYFSVLSATGPVEPAFEDEGELQVGDQLLLSYDYDNGRSAVRAGGWPCEVVRINAKSVTVKSLADDHQHMHRIQTIL